MEKPNNNLLHFLGKSEIKTKKKKKKNKETKIVEKRTLFQQHTSGCVANNSSDLDKWFAIKINR